VIEGEDVTLGIMSYVWQIFR